MADQSGRQSFRFRLPWVANAPAPVPSGAPAEPQPPSAPAVPPQRPPFRPPGAAPPRPFIPTRADSFPPSRMVSQPSSPSRQSLPPPQVVSQPPSPARTAPPPSPPSRQSLSPPQVVSGPPSPARTAPPPSPPSRQSLPPPQLASQTPSPARTAPPPSLTQKPSVTQPPLQPKSPPPQPSPTRVATPRTEKMPPRALVPKPEKEQETKQLVSLERPSGAIIATEVEKPKGKPDEREEPKQRTITELPSYKPDQQGQTRQDEPKIVPPVIQKGRTTSSTTESHLKPPSFGRGERPVSSPVNKLGTVGHPKQYLTEDESPVSVITLAGDNRGASMQLGRESARKEGPVHIHRGYKLNDNNQEDYSEMTTDGESSSKERKTRGPIQSGEEELKASRSYVNSNVQGVNNSIMFNSPYSETSPGVHLAFSRTVKEASMGSETSTGETRKADFSVSKAHKLTYEPTIRRRCLRGLMSEPSDSDPENPNKPRRHGCRYSCGQEKKNGNA